MRKVLIQRADVCDIINEIKWSTELLREITPLIAKSTGLDYVFDETDKCVYCICK